MSRLSTVTLIAAGFTLAACADSTKVTQPTGGLSPSSAASSDQLSWENPRHEMPTQSQAAGRAKPGGGGGGPGSGIFYHGGRVLLAGPNVAAIYWASGQVYTGGPTPGTYGDPSADGSLVGYFLKNLGGSPYFNINSTYTDGAGQNIANAVNYSQYWANNEYSVPSGSASVSDAAMLSMLQYGFEHGRLTYDPNTVYAIFTAGTVNLGGGFGTQYCAYHTSATVTINGVSTRVLYAAMPYDYAYPSACTASAASPNNDPGADAEVNTLAHETEEATTDADLNAWYDRQGYENADKCAWKWGTVLYTQSGAPYNITVGGLPFLVQMNWINQGSGGCRNGY